MNQTDLILLIQIYEGVCAFFIYRIWTRNPPGSVFERGCLTLALLVPFIGVLIYSFLVFKERPSENSDRPLLLDRNPLNEKAVAADPERLELLRLLRGEFDDALAKEMDTWGDNFPYPHATAGTFIEILQTGRVVPSGLTSDTDEMGRLQSLARVRLGQPLSLAERRYQARCLFASWILLHAGTQPENRQNGCPQEDEIALRGLTAGSLALGPPFTRAAARFVAWAQSEAAASDLPDVNLFYLLSLLILRCASPDKEDIAAALTVYDTLVAEEQKVRQRQTEDLDYLEPKPTWLFGLNFHWRNFDAKDWASMALWALALQSASGATALDPKLAELKQRLLALPQESSPSLPLPCPTPS